jgi:hypothetical protein
MLNYLKSFQSLVPPLSFCDGVNQCLRSRLPRCKLCSANSTPFTSAAERQRYLIQFRQDIAHELQPYLSETGRISNIIVRNILKELGLDLDKQLSEIISDACIQQRRAKT